METTDNSGYVTPGSEREMVLNQEAQYYLQQAAKWASFLAIMGFIGCGLILVVAIFAGAIITTMSRISPYPNPMMAMIGPFVGIFYFVIAAVMFFINLALYQFSNRVKKGVGFIDNAMVVSGLAKLRSYFKLKGIILIVVLSLYALVFVVMIVAGIGAASMMH